MTTSLFLIFNHTFTKAQRANALHALGVERIMDMPPDHKKIWSNIPPDLPTIEAYLEPVQAWLKTKSEKNDFVLIQGDFGACYIMVNYAFKLGLIPIYSTTRRETKEELFQDGSVKLTHHFQHQIFRRYEK
ncbi:MAG: hypothetical protein JRC68_04180 [Deltaproteobacteria bacterium]|nr:hypothetical protein [Deltaproteobacteria bacterium]